MSTTSNNVLSDEQLDYVNNCMAMADAETLEGDKHMAAAKDFIAYRDAPNANLSFLNANACFQRASIHNQNAMLAMVKAAVTSGNSGVMGFIPTLGGG